MAKEPKSPQLTEVALTKMVASVHTYESFGRAIIAAALSEAAKSSTSIAPSKMTATVHVTPVPHQKGSAAFSAGSSAAGSAATGPATPEPSISITICIGDSCHVFGI